MTGAANDQLLLISPAISVCAAIPFARLFFPCPFVMTAYLASYCLLVVAMLAKDVRRRDDGGSSGPRPAEWARKLRPSQAAAATDAQTTSRQHDAADAAI